jgi:hypothetical protein
MELLLWLYFYDKRWFFNIQMPFKIYKYIWFIPLFCHFFLISLGIYYMEISNGDHSGLKTGLWNQTLLSFTLSLNIIFFIFKMNQCYEKENKFVKTVRGALKYPSTFKEIHNHDYWIRRKTVFSSAGVILLFQGLFSIFFKSYSQEQILAESTNIRIQQALQFHSGLNYYCNFFIFLICLYLVIAKVSCFLLGSKRPNFVIKLGTLFHSTNCKVILHHKKIEDIQADCKVSFKKVQKLSI